MRSVARPAVFLFLVVFVSAISQATDPRIAYSTYLGGSKTSCTQPNGLACATVPPPTATAVATAVDASGNMYVLGVTNETDFPVTVGSATTPVYCNDGDFVCLPEAGFLAKFSAQGKLVYSRLLPETIQPYALAVDGVGNVYVAADGNLSGIFYHCFDAWIQKYSATGNLVYSYSPDKDAGTGECVATDSAVGIALNSSGTAAYVVGIANSGYGYIQTTPGAYKSAPTGSDNWVVKLDVANSSSASLVYGTYVGPVYPAGMFLAGSGPTQSVAVDAQGNAYIAGSTDGSYPVTSTALQKTYGGGTSDGFLTKLNATGTGLLYSTYLGGSSDDSVWSVRVDASNNATVSGTTKSSNVYSTASYGSGACATFVSRINASGSGRLFSTLLRGGCTVVQNPGLGSIALSSSVLGLDSAGNAYIAGSTNSTGFPKAIPWQSVLSGPSDAFFANLSSSGTGLLTSSYLGGSGKDSASAIVVDKVWNAYIVGNTTSTNFPVTANAYQTTRRGAQAVFLVKIIIEADLSVTASPSPSPVARGGTLTYTYAVTNKGPDSSDGDTLTTSIPAGTTYLGFTTTNGTCTHPTLGGTGTFKCTRAGSLLAGRSWGPITLKVKVNAASGSSLGDTVKVSAKTQDVVSSNNTASVYVKVQ